MIRRKIGAQKTFDQAPGAFIGGIVIGIVRLIIAGVMGFDFVLYNSNVLASTIVGAIIIPILAMVLFSLLKKNLEKDPKVIFGLRVGILAAAITSIIIALFGMSYYAGYSYTIFDTFVKDLVYFTDSGDSVSFIHNMVDDILTLMILVVLIPSVILVSKNMPRWSKGTMPVKTQTPSPTLNVPETVSRSTDYNCSNCGAPKIYMGQKFCEHCGTAFPPEIVVQPAASTEVSAPAALSPTVPAPPVTPAPTPPPVVVPPTPAIAPTPAPAPATPPPAPSPVPPAVTGSRTLQVTKVDWNKAKDALRKGGHKLEEITGKAYQRIFKKTPTQRTTRACIGVISLVIITSIILGAALTPARPLVGTWKMTFPTNFYVDTNAGGPMQNLGHEVRSNMIWVVSVWYADSSLLFIDVTFDCDNTHLSGTYVPAITSRDFRGYVSSSSLTLKTAAGEIVGTFTFTSWQIQGTWDETDSGLYDQRTYTTTNGLSLMKQ